MIVNKPSNSHIFYTAFLFLFMLSTVVQGFAQEKKKICVVQSSIAAFETDFIGNVYVVSGSALHCYSPKGEEQYTFEKKGYGKLSDVDCSNMHKLVLFYAEIGKFIFLDNNGAKIGSELSIRDLGLYNAESFIHASDGTIWLCNNDQQVFVQISRAGRILFTSTSWGRYINSSENNRLFVSEDFIVLTAENAIHLFTQQGAYIKTIHLTEQSQIVNLWRNEIFYIQADTIWSMNLHSMIEKPYRNQNSATILLCTTKQLFYLDGETVYTEKMQKQ